VPKHNTAARLLFLDSETLGLAGFNASPLELLLKNRHPKIARLCALAHTELKNLHDFFGGRAYRKGALDVSPCPG
jgi:hypothetical protein